MEECIACELSQGQRPLPGGLIHRTDHWLVEHCVGPLGVGSLVVKPERHVTHLADLTASEAAEMGPLLTQAAGVVTRLCAPGQVYVCLWSHAGGVPGHIHFVVQPVRNPKRKVPGTYGPALQVAMFARNRLPNMAEVERFADEARAAFSTG